MANCNVIDLFSGCGGFSVGFEKAGYRIIKAVEYDKSIAASYSHNHRDTIMFAEDIGKIDNEEHFTRGESEVIIGGPPCQGFSMAGARIREKNAFMNDPRNYLFRHYVNVVKIVRPKVFLLENVKGILSKDGGAIFREIVNAFSIDHLCVEVDKAYNAGTNILILSDRGVDENHVAIPSLLAVAAVHKHLVQTKRCTAMSIVLESGEPRETHHYCTLIGYGITAINPYLALDTDRKSVV